MISATIADQAGDAKNPRAARRFADRMKMTIGFARVGDARVAYQATSTGISS